jgi:hypothetical protein
MGFAQKVVVSDPLPPSAALPLYQGESRLRSPLEWATVAKRQGVAHTPCRSRLFVQSPMLI